MNIKEKENLPRSPPFGNALSKRFWAIIGFCLTPVVYFFDISTGNEVICTLFYLIPIAIITWFSARLIGIIAAVLNVFAWAFADILSGHIYSHISIFYWNSIVVFGIFIVVVFLLSALKNSLENQKALASTDYLTGAFNRRSFIDFLQMEIERSRRYKHPFSVAYIDLDNFKTVNDQFGHSEGDSVLRIVTNQARSQLRTTDICARLGGDEFAFLFPETGQEMVQMIISKLQFCLLGEMQKNKWPVTFSIGVLTCMNAPHTVDEVIEFIDRLMYAAKNEGKNAIKYRVYEG